MAAVPSLGGLDFVQGAPVTLESARGKVLVVEFWATWCPPCRTAIPHLSQLYDQYRGKGVEFVGITQEDRATATNYVKGMGAQMSYTVASDPTGRVSSLYSSQFGFKGIPAAVLIDRAGKVRYSGHPMEPSFASTLRQCVAEEPPAPVPSAEGLSRDELLAWKVKDLKAVLKAKGVGFGGLLEKSEFVDAVLKAVSPA